MRFIVTFNVLRRVWQELEYLLDVFRTTNGNNTVRTKLYASLTIHFLLSIKCVQNYAILKYNTVTLQAH